MDEEIKLIQECRVPNPKYPGTDAAGKPEREFSWSGRHNFQWIWGPSNNWTRQHMCTICGLVEDNGV